MPHLPADHPRGLAHKITQRKSDNCWTVVYAYPFAGSHALPEKDKAGSGHPPRPLEIMPDEVYQEAYALGHIERVHWYDVVHGDGAALRDRPISPFDLKGNDRDSHFEARGRGRSRTGARAR